MKKPELMAPVGNFEMLKAAIDGGADAVYFGVKDFNMRANAKNFSKNDLKEIVKVCHENKVKTYLALNIIIYENELKDVKNLLEEAKKSKVDMIICWDLAVIKLARDAGLEICASTQASISNSEAANFYKELGVKRIVLARECSLEQIKEIRKNTDLEIEVFIHGAMCVSVSGRCFLSHHLFNKSANRGECMQPCRREYSILDKEENGNELILGKDYVMSAKDLCSIMFIDKLIEAKIDSFKIEGRKRSPEYVFNVVKVYREAIDLYFENKLSEKKKEELFLELKKVFNRGFSEGFYFDKPSGKDFAETRNSAASTRKEFIGKITNYFDKIKVAALKIETGELKIKDKVLIQGEKTGNLEIEIEDLRFEDKKIKKASKGQEVSFNCQKARKNDKVYLVREI